MECRESNHHSSWIGRVHDKHSTTVLFLRLPGDTPLHLHFSVTEEAPIFQPSYFLTQFTLQDKLREELAL